VRKIKEDDGCYEVYAIKADGKKVEAYFNPATFELVKEDD
ncbi:MAG TPA: PepSY domain-containing protein, partial [Thalassospira sp.]|nr:PepSY domain-containing protein [Thalassospira sp.]